MQHRTRAVNGGTIGLVLGAVLYASSWLAVFSSGSGVTFYVWIACGGLSLGGLAGFTLGRERLFTPVLIALLVLLLGVIPTGGVDGGLSSPGAYSLVFLFGWPLLFVLAGLLALVEQSDSIRPQSPLYVAVRRMRVYSSPFIHRKPSCTVCHNCCRSDGSRGVSVLRVKRCQPQEREGEQQY